MSIFKESCFLCFSKFNHKLEQIDGKKKAHVFSNYHANIKHIGYIIIIIAEMAVFNVAGYLIEERRRWPVITASTRGQYSK